MEHQKILNLLNEQTDSKLVTRKWNIANDQSNPNYDAVNKIMCNIKVLKSNLCNYNDAYILIKGDITVTASPSPQVPFTNCPPFTKCITNIDVRTIYDAEDLDLFMPMYNLIEYSSFWNNRTFMVLFKR